MRMGATCVSWCVFVLAAACGGKEPDDRCRDNACDGPACVESWACTPWTTDGTSSSATRSCTDQSACGTADTKPVETAVLPALDPEYYECSVEPVLAQGCAMLACHGTET